MRRFGRLFFRSSILVAVLLATASYAPQEAGACPPYGRYDTYYDYGWTLNEIGWRERTCSCGTYGTGLTNGLWKVSELYDCDTWEVFDTMYFGRCNPGDPWTLMDGPTDYPNWC